MALFPLSVNSGHGRHKMHSWVVLCHVLLCPHQFFFFFFINKIDAIIASIS